MEFKETLSTPVSYECDVLVAGGGFGGIAAALAAARENKKVILLERQFMLGGLGTAGLVTIYLALCDGMGKQVSFGIAEELLKLSISLGAERDLGINWWGEEGQPRDEKSMRYEAQYNAQLFAILAEKELLNAGVNVLYGTFAVNTIVENDKISAVIIENKSGRSAIKVKSVVDATGDADIAYISGAPTVTNKNGNVLASWHYSVCEKNGYKLSPAGAYEERNSDDEVLVSRRFTGVDGQEISEFVQLSHQHLLKTVSARRKELGDDYVPVTMPTIPQFRMTRRLDGEYSLHDTEMHTYFDDSVGMVSDWRKRGPVYEVPFRTLYSRKIKNLLMAGRCTSVTNEMWDIMRVIPCCSVTGEAAGVAASMTDDFTTIDISLLQKKLQEKGVVIHENDL